MTQQPEYWYRAADMLPPYNVIVHLAYPGYEIKGGRGFDDKRKRDTWCEELRGGDRRFLSLRPEQIDRLIWRPQHPDKWKAPLPEPIERGAGRLWWSKQSMSAADMAEEMEADRVAATATAADVETDPFGRWWRGAGLDMRYEAAGAVTREWCEARVMRALAHCEWRRRTGMLVSGVEAALAEAEEAALRSMAEYELVHGADLAPRLRPLPSDEADFTIAMDWFTKLNDRPTVPYRLNWPQIVLESRARDERLTWQQIGIRLNRAKPPSPRTCRNTYRRAIDSCLRIANDVYAVDVRLEALRERNRDARRRA